MFTIGLAMTLQSGAYAEYKLAHDQLWSELVKGMREQQVSMAIYVDGNRLFLFASAPSKEAWELSRRDPILARWDAKMTQFLETDESGQIAFALLPKVFGFGSYA